MNGHIAIIGAGPAGLSAAREIIATTPDYVQVTLFDKSRGIGGRLATRYADPWKFDHGAQYFTARTAAFKSALEPLIAAGNIARWLPRTGLGAPRASGPRYVGVPNMNAVGKMMSEDLDIMTGTCITKMERHGGLWHLTDEAGTIWGQYDHVICAVPAPQAQDLLPQSFQDRIVLDEAEMLPAFTVMLGFAGPWTGDWDALYPDSEIIGYAAINSSKPGRDKTVTSIVVQAKNDWAASYIDADKEAVMDLMVAEFEKAGGVDARLAKHKVIHRWLYANVGNAGGKDFLFDTEQNLYACGDWCLEGRVEAAFLSGSRAGQFIAAMYDDAGGDDAK